MTYLLSIVIANYNYGRFLRGAIESVLNEGCENVELIVVDAGSNDNSIEIIHEYADNLGWWVSEPDKGQSEAFNKGFAHAHGKFLTWLNADDIVIPGSLKKLVAFIESNKEIEWFSGSTIYINTDGYIVNAGLKMSNRIAELFHAPAWARITAPSTIFSRELFNRLGPIDESLHYVMDTELWMRFYDAGVRLRYVNFYLWAFRLHEKSKTAASVTTGERCDRFLDERIQIRKLHHVGKLQDIKAVFLKRLGCMLSLGYVQRMLFLFRNKGRHIGEIG